MRLFRVDEGNVLTEYHEQPFDDVEETVENWLANNRRSIVAGGGLLIID